MENLRLDLLFFPGNYDVNKNPMLHGADAHILVTSHGEITRNDKSFTVVTPSCVSFAEVDFYVTQLISELESIRENARMRFEKDDQEREKYLKK